VGQGSGVSKPAEEGTSPHPPEVVTLRAPETRDGAKMFQFVQAFGGLEPNSAYAYLLLCERFSGSCLIAETPTQTAGFVLGITSATRPDVLFVWQIGVSPRHRKVGLGARMLDTLLARAKPRFLEAHVASGNVASEALFRAVGYRHSAPVATTPGLLSEWFPVQHEQERLFCIGPFAH